MKANLPLLEPNGIELDVRRKKWVPDAYYVKIIFRYRNFIYVNNEKMRAKGANFF